MASLPGGFSQRKDLDGLNYKLLHVDICHRMLLQHQLYAHILMYYYLSFKFLFVANIHGKNYIYHKVVLFLHHP